MTATWEHLRPDRVVGVRSVQAATEAAPAALEDGFSLVKVKGFTMMVECDAGKVFGSSAGQLDLYHLDPQIGLP